MTSVLSSSLKSIESEINRHYSSQSFIDNLKAQYNIKNLPKPSSSSSLNILSPIYPSQCNRYSYASCTF